LKDSRVMMKILQSLDPEFGYIAMAIEKSNNIYSMNIDKPWDP